jgi:hypothetical protein
MNKKKYGIKFLCLLGILIISDIITGMGLRFFYFQQKQGKLYNLTYTLEQQTAEILIMGSSRAMHHYNPEIISDSLHMPCFNAGYDGQSILYHKALLDVITERYTPRIIILDVNTYELDVNEDTYDLLSVLNPYAERHPALWKTLKLKSPFEKIKHISRIYPYNSLFTRIVIGNLHFNTKDVSANGFTAQKGTLNDSLKEVIYEDVPLDENKRNAFNQFLSDCIRKGITVYVVKSPAFEYGKNNSNSINYIIAACEKQQIPFISYQNKDDFAENHLFHDPGHLNNIGADKFSADFAHLMKSRNFYK